MELSEEMSCQKLKNHSFCVGGFQYFGTVDFGAESKILKQELY